MKKQVLIYAIALLGFSTMFISDANAYCGQAAVTAVSNLNNTSAVLEWTPITGIDGFNIRFRKMGATNWNYATSIAPSFNAEGLSPDVTYEFQVQTVCSGTASAYTEANKFTTLRHPNVAPASVSTNAVGGSHATISWSPVPGACTYQVQWKNVTSNGWTTVSALSSPSFSVRGLTTCTGYQFRVRTVCPMFTSPYSSTITINTNCPTANNTVSSSRLSDEEVEDAPSVNLYPNPVREKLNIDYHSTNNGVIKSNVINMIGNIVMSSVDEVQEGNNLLNMNTSQLASGIYFIEIENNGKIIRNKFMVSE